jgi:hypothetical protein
MPPLPSPGKVIKLENFFSNENGRGVNIFHIAYNGNPPSVADLNGLHSAIIASLDYIYNHNGAVSLTVYQQILTDLSSDTGASAEYTDSTTGTVAGAVLPMSAAVVVSWPILRRYRGGHPRSYFPLGTADTLEGTSTIDWQASFLTNVQNDALGFMNGVGDYTGPNIGNTTLVNVSYRSGGSLRPTPLVDLLQHPIAKVRICTQRRRLGKIGG